MCLYIDKCVHTETMKYRNRTLPKPFVANKDIPCVKYLIVHLLGDFLDDVKLPHRIIEYVTPYYEKRVAFDKNGVAEIVTDVNSKKLPFVIIKEDYGKIMFVVENGVHSWGKEKEATLFDKIYNHTPFKAIIPKGAMFYVGQNGDLVSNRLLIFKTEDALKQYLKDNEE